MMFYSNYYQHTASTIFMWNNIKYLIFNVDTPKSANLLLVHAANYSQYRDSVCTQQTGELSESYSEPELHVEHVQCFTNKQHRSQISANNDEFIL